MPQENRRFTPAQVEWLTKMFMSGANGGERIRDKKAAKLMKKEFEGKVDSVTKRPVCEPPPLCRLPALCSVPHGSDPGARRHRGPNS